MFFTFDFHGVEEDVQYILERYFPHIKLDDLQPVNKRTNLRQRRLILELCRYRFCGAEERQHLQAKARQAAKISSKPVYVLRELMQYLDEQRIVAPGYSLLQDTISQALTHEQNRLVIVVRTHVNDSDREAFRRLTDDPLGLYEITLLKREPKDFSFGEIKRELARGEHIQPLYLLAKQVLPLLDISSESIKYYASLVTYYSVFRLKQLDEHVIDVYLLCFVYHRYQRLHDNLINSLIYNDRRYTDQAKSAAKERVYGFQVERNQNLQKAGQVLKLFTDGNIDEDTPFQAVQARAFAILERQKLDRIADHIVTNTRFDEAAFQWDHIDTLVHQFKRNLRPILLAVDFAASRSRAPLLEAVDFLKTAFRKEKPLTQYATTDFPTRFIPSNLKRYLVIPDVSALGGSAAAQHGAKRLLVDRYEFLVYRLLCNGLEAGDIFCRDSVRFRSFEDDLIDDRQWKKKEELMAAAGHTVLNQPIQEHLASLEQLLEERLVAVNQRIASGENEHFQIKRRGQRARGAPEWILQSPRSNEAVNHPFYDSLGQVDIASLLHFVDQKCGFMSAFDHVLGRYVKRPANEFAINACLVAWGTNMGLGRMGEISDMSYHTLASTSDNFIRLETLKEANDRVSNATAELSIFQHYNIGEAVHSSSDGQKFETRIHTINARHSPKYFGLKKGIVSYTLVANHIPVNARIIGANEHESHYVFDLLFNNTTDIQPDVHSTDTHGTNEVNFAILHLFGYQFAPRYRDIQDKVRTGLYGFKHPSQYGEMLLQPIRKINTDLITAEEENIQRIMLSLALKTTTQNIIVGKLSAYARKNRTRRALWEYDNIIRSLYLLDYIDSPPLRRNVQRALNRGENYHQLRRAVSHANFGKLRFKTEQEQQLWNECSRLITNCVIYYNAVILSSLLEHKEESGDSSGAALISQISPLAWQHVNFYGRYEFTRGPEHIDIDAIIRELAEIPILSSG